MGIVFFKITAACYISVILYIIRNFFSCSVDILCMAKFINFFFICFSYFLRVFGNIYNYTKSKVIFIKAMCYKFILHIASLSCTFIKFVINLIKRAGSFIKIILYAIVSHVISLVPQFRGHKDVGYCYLSIGVLSGFLGSYMSLVIRSELYAPESILILNYF